SSSSRSSRSDRALFFRFGFVSGSSFGSGLDFDFGAGFSSGASGSGCGFGFAASGAAGTAKTAWQPGHLTFFPMAVSGTFSFFAQSGQDTTGMLSSQRFHDGVAHLRGRVFAAEVGRLHLSGRQYITHRFSHGRGALVEA